MYYIGDQPISPLFTLTRLLYFSGDAKSVFEVCPKIHVFSVFSVFSVKNKTKQKRGNHFPIFFLSIFFASDRPCL